MSWFVFHSCKQAVFEVCSTQGGLAQVVERSICIREAPGSIPGFSTFHHFAELIGKHCREARRLVFVLRSLTKVPGSIPGILKICRDPGLNQGPSDLQSDALPTELSRRCNLNSLILCGGTAKSAKSRFCKTTSTSSFAGLQNVCCTQGVS